MSSFTTRVELHEAGPDDYTTLHEEMGKEGFTRTIESSDGVRYQMPTAEYNYEGDVSRAKVRDKAATAAGRVKDKFGILVTESSGRSWQGLKKI